MRYWPSALLGVTLLQLFAFYTVPPTELGFYMLKPQPTQVVTSLVAHADVAHLISNVVAQLALGVFVECLHGHLRFLVVYVGSGVGGALWYRGTWCAGVSDESPGRNVYLVGASGAIYGLMGAYAGHMLINWSELRLKCVWFCGATLTVVLDVGMYLMAPVAHVAYAAHVGGALAGMCLGVLVLKNVRVLEHEVALRVGAAIALLLLSLAPVQISIDV